MAKQSTTAAERSISQALQFIADLGLARSRGSLAADLELVELERMAGFLLLRGPTAAITLVEECGPGSAYVLAWGLWCGVLVKAGAGRAGQVAVNPAVRDQCALRLFRAR